MFNNTRLSLTSKQRRCPVCAAFDSDGQTHLIYCGQWSCPVCSRRNADKWAARANAWFDDPANGKEAELWFMTLTLGRRFHTAAQGFSALPGLWDTTRKAYQRYYGTFTYIAFVEGQPLRTYMPHFHILTTTEPPIHRGKKGFVTKHGLHDFAIAYGWGFEADLQIVNSQEAALYVAKYASKQSPLTPKGFRRVRVSQDWPKGDPPSGGQWIVPAKDEDIAHFMVRVADYTNHDPRELWERWQVALQDLAERRANTPQRFDKPSQK